jgi:hypothetical protein
MQLLSTRLENISTWFFPTIAIPTEDLLLLVVIMISNISFVNPHLHRLSRILPSFRADAWMFLDKQARQARCLLVIT